MKSEYEQLLRAVHEKNSTHHSTQNREPPLLIGRVCHEISFLFGQLLYFAPPDGQQTPSLRNDRRKKSGDLFSCHFHQLDQCCQSLITQVSQDLPGELLDWPVQPCHQFEPRWRD